MIDAEKAARTLEKLLAYGRREGLLGEYDSIAARNRLLDKLELQEPSGDELSEEEVSELSESPQPLLDRLVEYAHQQNIIPGSTALYSDLFDTELMGVLMPRQSEVSKNFWKIAENESIEAATDYFYGMARASNYIRTARVAKNSRWRVQSEWGELEITINVAKPEKDPEEIAAAGKKEKTDYPRCALCVENVGYGGRPDHPARHNLRVIPVELEGEEWFLQYSPYVYYQEHCIVLARSHRPMHIDRSTFSRLFAFLDRFPHYFIGSNADLPLVGGSILSHDHFQGGRHQFPMERAGLKKTYEHPEYEGIEAGIIDWPMSAIRLKSAEAAPLRELAGLILEIWRKYSDPGLDILAFSGEKDGDAGEGSAAGGETNREDNPSHNTVTPIARINSQENKYELDLVLRNNRRSQEHPQGIFHPHSELHHIKKENIGLIEVMGQAILPGRLKDELAELEKILAGRRKITELESLEAEIGTGLKKHRDWLEDIIARRGCDHSREEAGQILREETASKFEQVLRDAGVFKGDESGKKGFDRFMRHTGFKNRKGDTAE